MKLLDKLYLNIYWCGNKGNGGYFIDNYFNKMFMIILFGLYMIIISLILSIFKLDIKISGILLISGLISLITSEKILKSYYTDERKKMIIANYIKPTKIRYLILILFALGSLVFMIFGSIIAGIVDNRLII